MLISQYGRPNRPRALPVLIVSTMLFAAGCNKSPDPAAAATQAAAAQKPPEVIVITAKNQSVTHTIEVAGRLLPYQVADVRPQASGIILKRLFDEGSSVHAGQPLYQLDHSTYQQTLNTNAAALQRQKANLAALEVKAKRYRGLLGSQAVSKQEYDDIMAQVALAQADVAAAQANLANARINLNYAVITAPISGQTGTSNVTPGALVTASQTTPLVTIQQLDPLYVNITQSSADMLRLRQQMAAGTVTRSGDTALTLKLADGSIYPLPAHLQFSNAAVDQATGAVTLRAVVANPQHLLLPGMYVTAQLPQGNLPNAILLPQQAVTHTPKGEASVLVVSGDNKVSQRVVTAPSTQGDQWVITDGLQPGERVILEGSQKIRIMPGAPAPMVNPISADSVKADSTGTDTAVPRAAPIASPVTNDKPAFPTNVPVNPSATPARSDAKTPSQGG